MVKEPNSSFLKQYLMRRVDVTSLIMPHAPGGGGTWHTDLRGVSPIFLGQMLTKSDIFG